MCQNTRNVRLKSEGELARNVARENPSSSRRGYESLQYSMHRDENIFLELVRVVTLQHLVRLPPNSRLACLEWAQLRKVVGNSSHVLTLAHGKLMSNIVFHLKRLVPAFAGRRVSLKPNRVYSRFTGHPGGVQIAGFSPWEINYVTIPGLLCHGIFPKHVLKINYVTLHHNNM